MSENDGWLPEAPEVPSSGGGRYDRIADWVEVPRKVGRKTISFYERRCRILGPGVSGLLAWSTDNKPFRFRPNEKVPADFKFRDNKYDPGKKESPAEFIAYPAWVYPGFKIIELAKFGLTSNFRSLAAKNGRPDGYDIVLVKGENEKGKVFYTCELYVPEDGQVKSPVPAEAAAAYAEAVAAGFDLNRLFDGGDPFSAPAAADGAAEQQGVPF